MLRIASRASVRWLVASSAVLAIGAGLAAGMRPQCTKQGAPAEVVHDVVEVSLVDVQEQPTVYRVPAAGECTAPDEAVRATAVVHFFDNEIDYATASDPASAKTAALIDLPMMCHASRYSYPALSRHIESAATVMMQRGQTDMARALLAVGTAYGVDARMVRSIRAQLDGY